MQRKEKRSVILILLLSVLLATAVFVGERMAAKPDHIVTRNSYGEGAKKEEYELTIPGVIEGEKLQVEAEERIYTKEEIQTLFRNAMEELDRVVLGDNEGFQRVETDLNLVTELPGYPMYIQWELDSYEVLNLQGEVQEEKVTEEGTLVEMRGTLIYEDEQAVYVRSLMVYPVTRKGTDALLYEVQQAVKRAEAATREDAEFTLPSRVNGQKIAWSRKREGRWYYVLLLGVVSAVFVVYKKRETEKQKQKKRKDALLKNYPDMVSKFAMLIGTGVTVRGTWEKIVQSYESQKEMLGTNLTYEEMKLTLQDMQSGVSETEAYETFGKRTGVTVYLKFGALLSQNLRKGSRGLADLLRMEAIQAFENRKNRAKQLGEEAGMKLLMPMLGMLAVVLIMVMVPAFLTMQL